MRPHLGHDAAVRDLDLLAGLAALGAQLLDRLDDVHALGDLAEHDVLAVQPRGDHGGDEELGCRRHEETSKQRQERGQKVRGRETRGDHGGDEELGAGSR